MNDNQFCVTFGIGDVVYLKSGSCAMVIEAITPHLTEVGVYKYHCIWQNYETKMILRDTFLADVLRRKT